MKKILSKIIFMVFVISLFGCLSNEKSYIEEALEIINLHDGAIYHLFEDKQIYEGVDAYYSISDLTSFEFEHEYNLFVIDVDKYSENTTVELLNQIHLLLESEKNVAFLFVNFSSYKIFQHSDFEVPGIIIFEHSSWALFRSNFSDSRSVNINGTLDEQTSFSAISLLARSINNG
ncbi:MAG: hypothetical protein Q7I99_04565 [Acholeplasmataceae bacterium]|nr:hypothetical protein [Acholeplasmataceae bacterium]